MKCIKKEWEKELGMDIAEDNWEKSLKYVNICSLNARHSVIQFKILHRLHYSKVKLHKNICFEFFFNLVIFIYYFTRLSLYINYVIS